MKELNNDVLMEGTEDYLGMTGEAFIKKYDPESYGKSNVTFAINNTDCDTLAYIFYFSQNANGGYALFAVGEYDREKRVLNKTDYPTMTYALSHETESDADVLKEVYHGLSYMASLHIREFVEKNS